MHINPWGVGGNIAVRDDFHFMEVGRARLSHGPMRPEIMKCRPPARLLSPRVMAASFLATIHFSDGGHSQTPPPRFVNAAVKYRASMRAATCVPLPQRKESKPQSKRNSKLSA
jgi:hypothetical protein